MPRRIFIALNYEDQDKARGFFLLKWNKNVDFEFVGQHLITPVDSTDPAYIHSKINDELKGTSVTVVLLGRNTASSPEKKGELNWVESEIMKSIQKDNPNGVVAIKLYDDVKVDKDSAVGKALDMAGAEIIGWNPHEFQDAIERAAETAGRSKGIQKSVSYQSDESCNR